jgi:hypothetical protein
LEENNTKDVNINNAKDIDIKDSNVKILVTAGESKTTNGVKKETDYWSLAIIVIIIVALAAYFIRTGHGIQINQNQITKDATEQK